VVHFSRRLLQHGSQSGEECSGVVLEPRWSNLLREKGCQPKYKKIILKYFKSPYIGLKNAKNIFQKTPQIWFYRGKINQVDNPVSEKPVLSHVVSCNEAVEGNPAPGEILG
jgi:hypothetical protein